jgi:hypothetical protein
MAVMVVVDTEVAAVANSMAPVEVASDPCKVITVTVLTQAIPTRTQAWLMVPTVLQWILKVISKQMRLVQNQVKLDPVCRVMQTISQQTPQTNHKEFPPSTVLIMYQLALDMVI